MVRKILIMLLVLATLMVVGGWTDADARDIAKTIRMEGNNQSLYEKSLIAWCILNRCDRDGRTVHQVVSAPHQFAYRKGAQVTAENLAIAEDVLTRWEIEKQFGGWVGRTLPADYFYFAGRGGHNWFRQKYRGRGRSHTFDNVDLYDHIHYLGGDEGDD